MYVIGSTGDDVNQYSLSTAWDVSTATFVRVSAAVGDTVPQDVFFKEDGTRMYIIGSTNDAVREFTLSTAWDVSTIAFSRTYLVGYLDALPSGIAFKSDGTEMYFSGNTNRVVYQLSLATAWNSGSVKGRFYVGNEELTPNALFFREDGLKMYLTGGSGADVNEYDLSTAWDIATATFLRVSTNVGDSGGLWFKDDGLKMYITATGADTIREFTLSTAWDVSTITFSKLLSVGFETNPCGATFKDDGTRIYLAGITNDVIYDIPVNTAWDVGTARGFAYIGATEATPRGLQINNDGTLLYLSGNSGLNIRKYTLSTAYEVSTAILSQSFPLAGVFNIHVSADGLKIYAATDSGGTLGGRQVRYISMTSPHDLTTATLNTTEVIPFYGLTGPVSSVFGVRVSPDGTRMFVVPDNVSGMYQFSLRFA
jgi:L-ascorbate metabolism protein UlaG (beta-lactamase superfamily)